MEDSDINVKEEDKNYAEVPRDYCQTLEFLMSKSREHNKSYE